MLFRPNIARFLAGPVRRSTTPNSAITNTNTHMNVVQNGSRSLSAVAVEAMVDTPSTVNFTDRCDRHVVDRCV